MRDRPLARIKAAFAFVVDFKNRSLAWTGNRHMMTRRIFIAAAAALPWWMLKTAGPHAEPQSSGPFEVTHSDEEWRKMLTPDQYAVLRRSGTERPYTSALLNEHRRGNFACAGCDLD